MINNSNYKGMVTIKFFDGKGNLKNTFSHHNVGTPYLYYIMASLLKEGNPQQQNYRPGRIMLTDKNGEPLLRTPVIKIASYDSVADWPLYDKDNNVIGYNSPCVRLEFNVSYWDLKANILEQEQGINNLTDYRFWLLSSSENEFKLKERESSTTIEADLKNITYETVILNNDYSKICAEVQLTTEGNNNTENNNNNDYSLNRGEYISVLWDMYFTDAIINNNNSTQP